MITGVTDTSLATLPAIADSAVGPAAERARREAPWWLWPTIAHLALLVGVLGALATADALGLPASEVAGLVATVVLTTTAAVLVAEVVASRPRRAPLPPPGPCPPATAIVVAYLPNEQDVIIATLEHLLALPHPSGLQVICAYNTTRPLPVEGELHDLARRTSRLVVLRIDASTSKAANVNAAVQHASGAIVGIFDADHRPAEGCFERAWRWLGNGYGIVQGRCRVRDGHRSGLARLVAAEFDAMYAVTHPGRAQVHGFAIFGGSNGYWRNDVLRAVPLDPDMLTEDIDASVRSLASGHRIAFDPTIVSTELAPPDLAALWNQRLRWSQGWTQVARCRVAAAVASPHVDRHARAGMAWVFGWCEAVPWATYLAVPAMVLDGVRWSATFAALLAFTLAAGPMLAAAAWRRTPSAERHPLGWYVAYGIAAIAPYGELLNGAKRIGHLRELGGRRQWVVTPRPRSAPTRSSSA